MTKDTPLVTGTMKDLNWHPLEQCPIDSHLVVMYKITYTLAAVPASEYFIRDTKSSSRVSTDFHSHRLLQKYTFFSKDYYTLECSTCQYTCI